MAAGDSLVNILGLTYLHRRVPGGGDLYLTRFGLPYARQLEIANWYEKQWFTAHRRRLEGTSSVYCVTTRPIDGLSLELVVKNSRMGEEVPLNTHTLREFINTEFNSPWEEFALVEELRESRPPTPDSPAIHTQSPLAIYIPPDKMQPWQTGRSVAKVKHLDARHAGIDIDILRQYKVIYQWIRGKNVVELLEELGYCGSALDRELEPITLQVIAHLHQRGFAVADMKPAHIIIDQEHIEALYREDHDPAHSRKERPNVRLCRWVREGHYSVVDYELLLRTREHEEEVQMVRRHCYLEEQSHRFTPSALPTHLKATNVFEVPYIWGRVESTGGQLWVVGRHGALFDYFLPERWRKTPSLRLSPHNDVFYTLTKDRIHLVWRTSRVGEVPFLPSLGRENSLLQKYGFNSPFEEFALAQYLAENDIPTVYMRAIYRTGSQKLESASDLRRYRYHRRFRTPEGDPVLQKNHNYISLRGYYNGPDPWVAQTEGPLYRPLSLLRGLQLGILETAQFRRLMDRLLSDLRNVGCDGALLRANDLLLAYHPEGYLVARPDGWPELRLCNLELLRGRSNASNRAGRPLDQTPGITPPKPAG